MPHFRRARGIRRRECVGRASSPRNRTPGDTQSARRCAVPMYLLRQCALFLLSRALCLIPAYGHRLRDLGHLPGKPGLCLCAPRLPPVACRSSALRCTRAVFLLLGSPFRAVVTANPAFRTAAASQRGPRFLHVRQHATKGERMQQGNGSHKETRGMTASGL